MVTSHAVGRCEPMAPELALVESDSESAGVTVLLELDRFCARVSHAPSDDEPLVKAVIQTLAVAT